METEDKPIYIYSGRKAPFGYKKMMKFHIFFSGFHDLETAKPKR